jgi:hypothetical protein
VYGVLSTSSLLSVVANETLVRHLPPLPFSGLIRLPICSSQQVFALLCLCGCHGPLALVPAVQQSVRSQKAFPDSPLILFGRPMYGVRKVLIYAQLS